MRSCIRVRRIIYNGIQILCGETMELCCSCFEPACTCPTPYICDIDDELYDIIVGFNRAFMRLGWDMRTKFCCIGHIREYNILPYILFTSRTRKYFPYLCENFSIYDVDYVFLRYRPVGKSWPTHMFYRWTFSLNTRNLNRCLDDVSCMDKEWLVKQQEQFISNCWCRIEALFDLLKQ